MANSDGSSLDPGCLMTSAHRRTASRSLLIPSWSDPSMAFQMTSKVAILKSSAA